MAGTISITGLSASEPAGQRVLGPLSIQGEIVVGDTQAMALQSGDNVVSIPNGSVGVVIIPPPTGAVSLLYRTSLNFSDAGLPISSSEPFVHVFPSPGPTNIYLNAGAAQPALVSFWVW